METYDFPLYLIPLLPLLGATFLGLLGSKLDRDLVTVVALGTVGGAFLVTCGATMTLVQHGPIRDFLWEWMAVGGRFEVDVVLAFDQLTAALMLVVTGVGFLIHVYSVGYMHDDPAYWRYFAYLNLFVCAMSILVLGASLPVMFVGWEGVGLASYLLIGFWYTDEEKADAGKKAFIVNRVGDFGFLIGIFTFIGFFGTADFASLKDAVAAIGSDTTVIIAEGIFEGMSREGVLNFGCLMLFVGACGKSAQIPLFVWLPDAMAGPTPVSALIHAATMVTSGVYMVSRMGFAFDLAPLAQDIVAVVGALTAVFAATIGLVQNDIKKVLAYSTVSQLGYMFLAAGLGAYSVAMFHVITHAFFKACLFLGSGAVIHAMHGEQDMRKMGGLKDKLPVVFWTFVVSTLAIAGIFPFAGFFSKDAILAHAFVENKSLFVLGMMGALMTAFYMWRLVAMTFFGELRNDDPHVVHHLHVPGANMRVPLIVLAVLAAFSGFMNVPHVFHMPLEANFEHFLEPIVGFKKLHLDVATEWVLMGLSVGLAAAAMRLAHVMYRNTPSTMADALAGNPAGQAMHKLLYGKWFIDELYSVLIVRPFHYIGRLISKVIDPGIIDGIAVHLAPRVVRGGGQLTRTLQTGDVQTYAGIFVLACGIIISLFLWV